MKKGKLIQDCFYGVYRQKVTLPRGRIPIIDDLCIERSLTLHTTNTTSIYPPPLTIDASRDHSHLSIYFLLSQWRKTINI